MTYATTYPQLVAEIQKYVDNDVPEFVAELPGMIARAQVRIQRDLDLDIWKGRFTTHVPFNQSIFSPGVDWLKIYRLFLVDLGRYVTRRSDAYVRMYGSQLGVPKYFAELSEGNLMLTPRPDNNYTIEVEYSQQLPVLSAAEPTNWIAENVADVLLYACLIEAEHFLISNERIAEFTQEYQQRMSAAVENLRNTRLNDQTPIRQAPIKGSAA